MKIAPAGKTNENGLPFSMRGVLYAPKIPRRGQRPMAAPQFQPGLCKPATRSGTRGVGYAFGAGGGAPCLGQVRMHMPWGWPGAPLPSAPWGCLGASPPWCGLEVPIGALWCGDVAWVHWDATGAAYLR